MERMGGETPEQLERRANRARWRAEQCLSARGSQVDRVANATRRHLLALEEFLRMQERRARGRS